MGDVHFPLLDADLAAVFGGNGRFIQRGDHIACLDFVLILDLDLPFFRHIELIVDHFTLFDAHQAHIGIFVRLDDAHRALDLGDDGFTLRHLAGFEELFHARQTGGDVTAGSHTAGMEGAQGQLRARLADGLGSHDTDRRTHFNHRAATQIEAVAFGSRCHGSVHRSALNGL